jgi:hypothetical protein
MSDNPLIYSDNQLEDLEARLRIFPDDPVDQAVVERLLYTAIRARRILASLRNGPVKRSLPRTRAMIDFGLGETREVHQ